MAVIDFIYTGANQSWTVPSGVTSLEVECWGAQGGESSTTGAEGGYIKATVPVNPGETLTVIVGGKGGDRTASGAAGGWPDGGSGASRGSTGNQGGGGGGGSSRVMRGTSALVAAGGGGGSSGWGYQTGDAKLGGKGGGGNGAKGGTGTRSGNATAGSGEGGYGATRTAPGSGGSSGSNTSNGGGGSGHVGGAGSTVGGTGSYSGGGGGGGGGWFGGGGGEGGDDGAGGGGGGGGSSNTIGTIVTETLGARTGNGAVRITHADNAAPNTPTLVAPGNATTQDLAAGFTFDWTFSDPNSGDTQSAYAMRRKISGAASYEYWNASTGAWQTTEVWNTATADQITFASGKWTNGNIYNWSVATKDAAGMAGPYATDFTVTASTPPTVTVTAPSGTAVSTRPTVIWSVNDPEGDPQQTYHVKVFDSATFTGAGFDPNTSTAIWTSGEVTSSTTSVVIGTDLTNNGSYRAYVRTKHASQYSAWAYSAFTISLDAPATPSISATMDNPQNRVQLVVTGYDNMLTENQASIETDTTGWLNAGNATLARSTAAASHGSASLAVTAAAAGDVLAETSPQGTGAVPVSPGRVYTALAAFRAATVGRTCRVAVYFFDSAGSAIGPTYGADVVSTTTGWTQAAAEVPAPANAAFAIVRVVIVGAAAAGEVHYVDSIGLFPRSTTTWSRGGLSGISRFLVEYSDDAGNTWTTVRNASDVAQTNQQATVFDYEIPPKTTRQYRARTFADV